VHSLTIIPALAAHLVAWSSSPPCLPSSHREHRRADICKALMFSGDRTAKLYVGINSEPRNETLNEVLGKIRNHFLLIELCATCDRNEACALKE